MGKSTAILDAEEMCATTATSSWQCLPDSLTLKPQGALTACRCIALDGRKDLGNALVLRGASLVEMSGHEPDLMDLEFMLQDWTDIVLEQLHRQPSVARWGVHGHRQPWMHADLADSEEMLASLDEQCVQIWISRNLPFTNEIRDLWRSPCSVKK